jgi:hypothetical protein
MAPRKMPVRRQQTREISKVLSEGTYTTTDPQGQINVMRQYQAANLIPKQFEAPNQVSDAVSAEMKSGLTKEQALNKLNITLPRSFFDNKGKLIGRKFRDAQSPALIEAWNKATGGLPAEALGKLEGAEWSNQQKVLQEVGRRLGMKLDLGHFETSASGAPGNIAAAGGEYNLANQAAGRSLENPFRPQTQAEVADIGMATNKVQGLSEAFLLTEDLPTRGGLTGSPLNPYISVLLGTTLSGQKSRLLPQENLEMLNYTFDQLEKQGANPVAMYDYIRERAGEGIDINEMARAGREQYDISKFAPKVEAPNAGTVKILQTAPPKGPTVTTKGVPKGLTAEPQVVLTRSQTLGQMAAKIANREPVAPIRAEVVVPTTSAAKPVVKSTTKAKPKPKVRTAPAVVTQKTRTKPESASMQIRAMQRSAPDVINIQPGMSLPSSSLIQGI